MGTAVVMPPATLRPVRLPVPGEPVWVTPAPGQPHAVALFLHAIGENRTGNNYLLAELAHACAAAGVASVRFDLPGCGENRGRLTAAAWDARVAVVSGAVDTRYAQLPVHWIARGLSAAFLPVAGGSGLRIALNPPDPAALDDALAGVQSTLAPCQPVTAPEASMWRAIGAEPNLIGGLRVPTATLRDMCRRLDDRRWDLAVVAAGSDGPTGRAAFRMSTDDVLFRFESDRAAIAVLIPRLLGSWQQWRRAPS
jgi:hypothetical protein